MILSCTQKLTGSQRGLPHMTRNNTVNKDKLKQKPISTKSSRKVRESIKVHLTRTSDVVQYSRNHTAADTCTQQAKQPSGLDTQLSQAEHGHYLSGQLSSLDLYC